MKENFVKKTLYIKYKIVDCYELFQVKIMQYVPSPDENRSSEKSEQQRTKLIKLWKLMLNYFNPKQLLQVFAFDTDYS